MKAYIVEDYESMRIILKRLLKKNFSEISAIGESETAENALVEIPLFKPSIVLVDISLPGMDGIELTRRLKEQSAHICILVVTAHEVDYYRNKAMQAGAYDIVSKIDYNLLITVIDSLLNQSKKEGCK